MGIVTLPDGRIIDTERNLLLEKGIELLSMNEPLVSFIADDASAYQAFLSFQNTEWVLPDGGRFLLGWIGCSALVMTLRGLSDDPKRLWWKSHDDPDEPDQVALDLIEAMLNTSGWKKLVFKETTHGA